MDVSALSDIRTLLCMGITVRRSAILVGMLLVASLFVVMVQSDSVKADITCRDSGVNCRWRVVAPAAEAGQVHICTVDVCANGFAGRTYELEGDYAFDGVNPNASTTTSSSSTTTTTTNTSTTTVAPTSSDGTDSTAVSSTTVPITIVTTTTTTIPFNVDCMSVGVACGWAVVDSSGVVRGVIVCQVSVCGPDGDWRGRLPVEYMGCPAGCRLVLQAQQTRDGNVAGWHGSDVVYNDSSNTFSLPGGGSLKSGERLDDAVFPTTTTTTVAPDAPTPTTTLPENLNDVDVVTQDGLIYDTVDAYVGSEAVVTVTPIMVTVALPPLDAKNVSYIATFDPVGPAKSFVLEQGDLDSKSISALAASSRNRSLRISLAKLKNSEGLLKVVFKTRFATIGQISTNVANASRFTSCTSLRKIYPSGVAARRVTQKEVSKSVIAKVRPKPIVNAAAYRLNKYLDFDKDQIACESKVS
jgi:hypothetical protein